MQQIFSKKTEKHDGQSFSYSAHTPDDINKKSDYDIFFTNTHKIDCYALKQFIDI